MAMSKAQLELKREIQQATEFELKKELFQEVLKELQDDYMKT